MSKLDDAIASYIETFAKLEGHELDAALLTNMTKGLGPLIYDADASLVSCTDQAERDRVKNNFLIKKLGISSEDHDLDGAIEEVCQIMKPLRFKPRAIFYYFLVKKFGSESVYMGE